MLELACSNRVPKRGHIWPILCLSRELSKHLEDFDFLPMEYFPVFQVYFDEAVFMPRYAHLNPRIDRVWRSRLRQFSIHSVEDFIVQSWEPLPTMMLPESDSGSLTYEVNGISKFVR
jgi:hypothetical protein